MKSTGRRFDEWELAYNHDMNGYRFSVAVQAIVTSRQFREIRGKEAGDE